jgi:hypothetical protein
MQLAFLVPNAAWRLLLGCGMRIERVLANSFFGFPVGLTHTYLPPVGMSGRDRYSVRFQPAIQGKAG